MSHLPTNADDAATGYFSQDYGTSAGFTKREEFAKAAMTGLLSNPNAHTIYAEGFSDLMKTATEAADALIAALNAAPDAQEQP